MVSLTVDGHCPVCQGPAQIEMRQIDVHTTEFTCEKHPQFSHRLTLPTALPLGYVVVDVHAGVLDVRHTMHATPQEAAVEADRLRDFYTASGQTLTSVKFGVASVTLIEDLA